MMPEHRVGDGSMAAGRARGGARIPRMPARHRALLPWLIAWLALSALAALGLSRWELNRLREVFDTDARIAHRLLSQRAVQHDTILATLSLLQPEVQAREGASPALRLPAVYPQVLSVLQRERGQTWPQPDLQAAEARSRELRHAVLARTDLAAARATVLLAAEPASFALELDLARPMAGAEWPLRADGPVRATLSIAGQSLTLQGGAADWAGGWQFAARKTLASESQPFELELVRRVGWAELPWSRMGVVTALLAGLLAAGHSALAQRAARRRAEELLRLGQISRLNTLGELAAGMAHELNQPLTAVLAGTQAAARMLADDPPDIALSRQAMEHASAQARRASEVLTRLRRTVERPDAQLAPRPLNLIDVARDVLDLLAPECARRGVTVGLEAASAPLVVASEPVALQQIVHNLVMNALQAMEQVGEGQRELVLVMTQAPEGRAELSVRDSGPGIAPDALPRLFEPFYSTRAGGLGLGLSLCETLALGLGGSLRAANREPRGAQFTLSLPLA